MGREDIYQLVEVLAEPKVKSSFTEALRLFSCFGDVSKTTWHKAKRFRLVENLQSARCCPSIFSKVLAARKANVITARARKYKRTARMLANACQDHSIPLYFLSHNFGVQIFLLKFSNSLIIHEG